MHCPLVEIEIRCGPLVKNSYLTCNIWSDCLISVYHSWAKYCLWHRLLELLYLCLVGMLSWYLRIKQLIAWFKFKQSTVVNILEDFLINIFIDHHTVNSQLLIHLCNTDTIYELISGQKRLDIFTFTVLISYTCWIMN